MSLDNLLSKPGVLPQLEAELSRRQQSKSLLAYVEATETHRPALHHRLLIEKLEAIQAGTLKRLMVFMPPGTAKSTYCSVLFPAWYLGKHPTEPLIMATHTQDLSERFGRRVRNRVASQEFAEVFGIGVAGDSSAAGRWETTEGGEFFAIGVGSAVTGRRARGAIIDDPLKGRDDADSKTVRDRLWDWYTSDFRTRLLPDAWLILIATRWHSDDLAGRILPARWNGESGKITARDGEKWFVLSLPMEAREGDVLGRTPGELLWPEFFTPEVVAAEKRIQGSRNWSALYQQLPTPEGGAIFRREHLKFYREPPELDEVALSWDCTFKDVATSDFVAGQAWGRKGADRFLLARVRARMGFAATCAAIRAQKAQFPRAVAVLVEDKANGSAVIETLRKEIAGVIAVNPQGGKVARAYAAQPQFEAGNVWLPDPSIAPWVGEFIEELCGFPTAVHDDEVDAATQALVWFTGRRWSGGGNILEFWRLQREERALSSRLSRLAHVTRCDNSVSVAGTLLPNQRPRAGGAVAHRGAPLCGAWPAHRRNGRTAMIHVHVAGELIKPPAPKTSSGGKPYALLLMKAGNGEASQIVSALVFGELAEAALALEKGDSVSVAGRASLGVYERNGEPTPSLTVFVSQLLAGKPEPRKKASRAEPQPARVEHASATRQEATRSPGAGGGHFDDMADDIPF
ncbi:MAG: phage terminase large subunit [Betaproteobacteria bacterium]|nr:phage terminase large subunit [Betaproteobacteria bacterium]